MFFETLLSEVIFKMLVLEGLKLDDLDAFFQQDASLLDTNMQLSHDYGNFGEGKLVD